MILQYFILFCFKLLTYKLMLVIKDKGGNIVWFGFGCTFRLALEIRWW
jgi:hypothetical protein